MKAGFMADRLSPTQLFAGWQFTKNFNRCPIRRGWLGLQTKKFLTPIVGLSPAAMKGRPTTGRLRSPRDTAQRRSKRPASDGWVGVRGKQAPFGHLVRSKNNRRQQTAINIVSQGSGTAQGCVLTVAGADRVLADGQISSSIDRVLGDRQDLTAIICRDFVSITFRVHVSAFIA